MRLDAFPDGGTLFLDANIFLYHCWGQSPSCRYVIGRIETGLIQGVTSTTILNETTHRLLLAEVVATHPRPIRHPARFLKRHPEVVRTLSGTWRAIERLARLPLQVVGVTPAIWHEAVAISRELGLLMNDALTVAAMRAHHLVHLASNDRDFARVHGLTLWRP